MPENWSGYAAPEKGYIDGERMPRVKPPQRWESLLLHGRHIFYEGDDPAGWIDVIRYNFGLDPLLFEVTQWRDGEIVCCYRVPDPAGFIRNRDSDRYTVAIDCPGAVYQEIYTGGKYGPMGS